MSAKNLVVVIDDDPEWVAIIKQLLQDAGFTCLSSKNYIGAIKILQSANPLALILDLKLDNTSLNDNEWAGWQLAQLAKERKISSIIVTGYPRDDRYHRAYKSFDAVGFFEKSHFVNRKAMFVKSVWDAVNKTQRRQSKLTDRRKKSKDESASSDVDKKKNTTSNKNIFISYSHKDRKWLIKFTTHLKVLVNSKQIRIWDDTKIKSGAIWKDEIMKALSTAKVAILLVTPDFLASDFINKTELPVIFRGAKKKGVKIFWVAIKPSLYEETYIAKFQSVNDPNKPLTSLTSSRVEQEIVQICKKVKEAMM